MAASAAAYPDPEEGCHLSATSIIKQHIIRRVMSVDRQI